MAFSSIALASDQARRTDPFADACSISGYDCRGVKAPLVVDTPMQGLLGRYRLGDPYVLVLEGVPERLRYIIAVHEMVHFLQARDGWAFSRTAACAREKEAFDVANVVAARMGELQYVIDWNKARVWYGCPP